MMEFFLDNAPSIGLILFFSIFLGVLAWVFMPANKTRLKNYANIPLQEENHGN